MKNRSPFNTPLETGVRLLFVLQACAPSAFDLQRLVYLDYLLVNSGDFPDGPPSIHPATPYRSGAWIVRRKAVADGLDLMFAKELLGKHFNSEGITYSASDLTLPFLGHLESAYSQRLRDVAAWLAANVVVLPSDELRTFMDEHVGAWGAEFRIDTLTTGTDE